MPSLLPEPPALTPITLEADSTSPTKPKRKIFTSADLDPWFSSQARSDLEEYALQLCRAVEGKGAEDPCHESEVTQSIVMFLEQARGWIDETPLQTTPQRFGNKAFRTWLSKVTHRNEEFQASLVAACPHFGKEKVLPELAFNFLASFGSAPRLDYGTGHELSFMLWLLSLRLLGVLSPRDDQAVVLRVFKAYLDLVRRLQLVFKLEPAGSKGVWGLDDHQHLNYLFGASQLIDHPSLRPSHILELRSLAPLAQTYLLPASILHIHTLKTGPFFEHSPLLYQIATTVPSWSKMQVGLWKMYREEVLGKVPVVQHLRFGLLIRWRQTVTGEDLPSTGDGRADGEDEDEVGKDVERPEDEAMNAPWIQQSASRQHAPSPITTVSHAAARRTPHSLSFTTRPSSFSPPALFPPRYNTATPLKSTPLASASRTMAEEGGPAAQSSPFGILASATEGTGASEADAQRSAGQGQKGSALTKAPWAV